MSSARIEPVRWPRRRWWAVILLVLALHLGAIFWLRGPPQVSGARSSPAFRLHFAAGGEARQAVLEARFISDPTLFALPSQNGFSGQAWLQFRPLEHRIENWNEPPTWLNLKAGRLGQSFSRFMATNAPASYQIADQPLPFATILDIGMSGTMVETQSVLRLEGNLARRGLLAPLRLRSWEHTDILLNSVVQVVVDGAGLTISARLLAESGYASADQEALRLAKAARFRPLRAPAGERPRESAIETPVGKLIFEWHTVPKTAANAPAEGPRL